MVARCSTAASLLCVVLICCGVPETFAEGADDSAAPLPDKAENAPRPVRIGERIEANGIALTVVKVGQTRGLGKFIAAKEGNEFIVVSVLIETTGRDNAPYHWKDFTAKDNENAEYLPRRHPFEEGLQDGILAKGKKVQGQVAFEVKKGTVFAEVAYRPAVEDKGFQPLRVRLDK